MKTFFRSRGRAEAPLIFMMQRYHCEPAGHLTIFLPRQMDSATSTASALTRIAAALDLPQPEAFAL